MIAKIRSDALEEAAQVLDIKSADLLLMAGEMTAQELRTVRAVLKGLKEKIRSLGGKKCT